MPGRRRGSLAPPLKKKSTRTVYFASELFSLKHLLGNAYLAEAIYEKSHGKYLCRLPQDFTARGVHPHYVRDQNIRALFECDVGLFSFDGAELASGTVVEFMLAKFADMPAVILRSDLRRAGEPAGRRRDPWNVMTDFYPRTASVAVNSLVDYRVSQKRRARGRRLALDEVVRLAGQHDSAIAAVVCDQLAAAVVRALDRVEQMEPVMPKYLREGVYQWLARMPGLRGKEKALRKELEELLERKVRRELL